jgi:hypothetical protein
MKTTEMSDEQLQSEIDKNQVLLDLLSAEQESLGNKIKNANDTTTRLAKERANRSYAKMLAANKIDWGTLLTMEVGEPYYEMLDSEFAKRVPDGSVSHSGYSPDAMQYMLRVAFIRGDQKQVVSASKVINEILPVMKITDNEKGWIAFSIMDHGLSEYETYSLVYKPDTKQWLVGTYRAYKGRCDWQHGPFDKLEEALTVISNNYWYKLPDIEGAAEYEDDE